MYVCVGNINHPLHIIGVVMFLPQNKSKTLKFGVTSNDEFFSPEFEVVPATGELLWPWSKNASQVKRVIVHFICVVVVLE